MWVICRLADNSISCWQLSACWAYEVYFFMVLRAMFVIFGLKSVIKQLLNLLFGFQSALEMYSKTIIGFGFCDMQNYQCLGNW